MVAARLRRDCQRARLWYPASDGIATVLLPALQPDLTMSVLIEALTLVVPRRELDMRFPGGTSAFLEATLGLERPPRFVCGGDAHLVNLSFYDADHLAPAADLLLAHGFVDVEANRVVDVAYVEQRFGPTMPCDWLEWRNHADGFTYAWLAGTEPGDMAAPIDWTPERSRAMLREDIRDDRERMNKLAEENGIETWLDTSTGRQIVSLAAREALVEQGAAGGTAVSRTKAARVAARSGEVTSAVTDDSRGEATELLGVLRRSLAAHDVEHTVAEAVDGGPVSVAFVLRGRHTAYEFFVAIDRRSPSSRASTRSRPTRGRGVSACAHCSTRGSPASSTSLRRASTCSCPTSRCCTSSPRSAASPPSTAA